jgi:transposase
VQNASIWRALLCVENTVVEDVEFDDQAQVLVVYVRPRRASRGRCGMCGSRSSWYDRGQGRRRWRGLDMGTIRVFLEADAPRVNCSAHGPTVRQVPWARHGAGHTRCFDQQVAWLATQCSKRAITELMRIAWRTVGAIITRVWADTAAGVDAFAGLQRVGIDEISYKRRHKYLTVVVDHDSGRLVWASPGRERATVHAFFDALQASGQGRCARITHVTADGAEWIADVVSNRCPTAVRCADPFHVVSAGPPRHWMPCVAKRGATPAAGVTPAITGGPMAGAPPYPPDQRWHCDAHGTHCGRTRRTSPIANR